jgi:agmatine deiminase
MRQPPPPEWAAQQALYTAFPSHPELWGDDLGPAQGEVAALVRALAATVPVRLLCANEDAAAAAAAQTAGADVRIVRIPFGDIWLRDTAPVFLSRRQAAGFRFNGWGGKYVLAGDAGVAAAVASDAGAELAAHDFVLEGGAIDGDGSGLFVTTEQCLLNPNRNPAMDRRAVELALGEALGARRLIWLGEGLAHDHTDGHVDNLARFAAPGTILLPVAAGADDPNAAVYEDARRRLAGSGVVVIDMPSVGRYAPDGEIAPASYMNFVVANGQVVVPHYGAANDAAAVAALRRAFPRHRVTGLPATHVLTGGGSFHCITQQVPEG